MLYSLIKFALIGCGSSLVNLFVYNTCLQLLRFFGLGFREDYLIALFIGFLMSVLWSFLLSRKFVFNTPEEKAVPWYKVLFKMYLVYSFTGVVLSSLMSLLWVRILGIPEAIVPLLNDCICFPITFLLNKFWAFGAKKTN